MTWHPDTNNGDQYMNQRTGKYEWRAVRYRAAIEKMYEMGLDDSMTIMDIGAGWTEMDYTLRAEYGWRGRYIPIDCGIDNTDLNTWVPVRDAHFMVALEIYEHLTNWRMLEMRLREHAAVGVIMSTPNPLTTDVLGMDETHVTEIHTETLTGLGYEVFEKTFYGGAFSGGKPDSLFGVWKR